MMMDRRLELIRGDITSLEVDAIVNAANNSLLGGGGVDGVIHRTAGPGLYDECKRLNGCETGKAKITRGYNLKARHIIHTVGPIWYGGYHDEHETLASCYQTSLDLAKKNKIKTIAFPGISTGVYGFPKDLAALIAVNESKRFLKKNSFPEKVIFVAYDDESYETYRKLLNP
jgi:O-acetyl-ADP-ribose deacetylase (regulator of RNase III)